MCFDLPGCVDVSINPRALPLQRFFHVPTRLRVTGEISDANCFEAPPANPDSSTATFVKCNAASQRRFKTHQRATEVNWRLRLRQLSRNAAL